MDERPANRVSLAWWRRHPLLSVALGLVIAALLVPAAKLLLDWPAHPAPIPLRIQLAAEGRLDLIGEAREYDFWGNFIDSQHLWRVEIDPTLLPTLTKQYGVIELESAEQIPDPFWRQIPYWWRPPRSGAARYFASPGFQAYSRGSDGDYYLMAYDEVNGVLYAWYKNNF